MSDFDGLRIALSSLYAPRKALQVSGQNIANSNTEAGDDIFTVLSDAASDVRTNPADLTSTDLSRLDAGYSACRTPCPRSAPDAIRSRS